jgi:hypothetical protein
VYQPPDALISSTVIPASKPRAFKTAGACRLASLSLSAAGRSEFAIALSRAAISSAWALLQTKLHTASKDNTDFIIITLLCEFLVLILPSIFKCGFKLEISPKALIFKDKF